MRYAHFQSFQEVVEDTVRGLQSQFTKYLGDDCDQGAILVRSDNSCRHSFTQAEPHNVQAAAAAVKTSTRFADRKEMIWQRYRARELTILYPFDHQLMCMLSSSTSKWTLWRVRSQRRVDHSIRQPYRPELDQTVSIEPLPSVQDRDHSGCGGAHQSSCPVRTRVSDNAREKASRRFLGTNIRIHRRIRDCRAAYS